MTVTTIQDRYTPDDLLRLPDFNGDLVDGQLVEKAMSSWTSYVAGTIFHLLKLYSKDHFLGWVFPQGASFKCFRVHPDRVRRPDTSFILYERLPREQVVARGHLTAVPNLVVEVISPNDLAYDVESKALDWLDAGVATLWLIYPDAEAVTVRSASSSIVLRAEQELTEPVLLPGFRCLVGDLFLV